MRKKKSKNCIVSIIVGYNCKNINVHCKWKVLVQQFHTFCVATKIQIKFCKTKFQSNAKCDIDLSCIILAGL